MGLFLRWGNWAVAKLTETLFNTVYLSDVGCTFRVITRKGLDRLTPEFEGNGSSFGFEMMLHAARLRVPLPPGALAAVRVQILSTHDPQGARSCGLNELRLLADGQPLALDGAQIHASSQFPGHEAFHLLDNRAAPGQSPGYAAQVGLDDLAAARRRMAGLGRPLELAAVVYAHQLDPAIAPLLATGAGLADFRSATIAAVRGGLTVRDLELGLGRAGAEPGETVPTESGVLQALDGLLKANPEAADDARTAHCGHGVVGCQRQAAVAVLVHRRSQ